MSTLQDNFIHKIKDYQTQFENIDKTITKLNCDLETKNSRITLENLIDCYIAKNITSCIKFEVFENIESAKYYLNMLEKYNENSAIIFLHKSHLWLIESYWISYKNIFLANFRFKISI